MLFNALKFVHILAAIVAVGFNASYGIWLARAAAAPQNLSHSLRTIRILDDRFANPAYGLLLLTGLAMVLVGSIPFTTLWIDLGLALWVVLILGGLLVYTPTLRRQIQVLEASGPESAEYRRLDARARVSGIALAVLVVVIVGVMVFKPHL